MFSQTKKITAVFALVAFGFVTFAAIGITGEGNKAKRKSILGDFTPIRTTSGFTLKSGPNYKGSVIFNQEKTNKALSFNTVVTYQKGNTTYILPYKYKISSQTAGSRSNLQLLNLKVNLHK